MRASFPFPAAGALTRAAARRLLFPMVTEATALGLRALWGQRAPQALTSPGREVLIVGAHPDDETIGAGGVAALHARLGDRVSVVVLTDGGRSRAFHLAPQQMIERRRAEVQAAARLLGVAAVHCLALPERTWPHDEARALLAPLVAGADLLYAPSCVDYHPDHCALARLLAEMVQPEQRLRVYETAVPLTPLLVNVVVNISCTFETKHRALRCFATQRGAIAPLLRLERYRAALYGTAACEPFWELSGAAYRRVMGETFPFRALRPRPFTDLLAWLVGSGARRRLRAAALGAS